MNSEKNISLSNNADIYFGENKIGYINISFPAQIGNIDVTELTFTLVITNGIVQLNYEIEPDENNKCAVPITDDITESVGEWELYIKIAGEGRVIGKTNLSKFIVHDSLQNYIEIPKREELIAESERLSGLLTQSNSALALVKSALIFMGLEITDQTPASDYGYLIRSLPTFDIFKNYIQRTITEITIPIVTTSIGTHAFVGCSNLREVTLNEGLVSISNEAFSGCRSLTAINFPSTLETISNSAFYNCSGLTTLVFPHGLSTIGASAFQNCGKITRLHLPNTITDIGYNAFSWALKSNAEVTIENGFSCDGLDLSQVNASVQDIVSWLNALADLSNIETRFINIGSNNLNKLTADQIAIATNKNWYIS